MKLRTSNQNPTCCFLFSSLYHEVAKNTILFLLLFVFSMASFSGYATTYTTTAINTWDANGAPPNPLPSGDIVNINHIGTFYDHPFTVTFQSGSTVNINNGGGLSTANTVTIDLGATFNLNAGGLWQGSGNLVINSNNVLIDGSLDLG